MRLWADLVEEGKTKGKAPCYVCQVFCCYNSSNSEYLEHEPEEVEGDEEDREEPDDSGTERTVRHECQSCSDGWVTPAPYDLRTSGRDEQGAVISYLRVNAENWQCSEEERRMYAQIANEIENGNHWRKGKP